MLQEQQQQLQQLLGSLQDTLKTVTTKLDDQSAATRKAMADQTLAIDQHRRQRARPAREGRRHQRADLDDGAGDRGAAADDSRRMPAPQPVRRRTPAGRRRSDAAPPAAGTPAPPPAPAAAAARRIVAAADVRHELRRLHRRPLRHWRSRASRPSSRRFPRRRRPAHAQFNIGMSYYNQGKWTEARDAFLKVITTTRRRGQRRSQTRTTSSDRPTSALKQIDVAKKAYETVVQKFPGPPSALDPGASSGCRRELAEADVRIASTKLRPPNCSANLERNIVVGEVADRLAHRLVIATAAGCRRRPPRRCGRGAAARPPATATAAAEQDDPVAADLGRVLVVAVLVLPLPRLQPSLDVDLLALRQVLDERLRRTCPTGRCGATRFFPASGPTSCRSTLRWSPGSASRPARRPACSAAPRPSRDCRPGSPCSRCPCVSSRSSVFRPRLRSRDSATSAARSGPRAARRPCSSGVETSKMSQSVIAVIRCTVFGVTCTASPGFISRSSSGRRRRLALRSRTASVRTTG